MVNQYYRIFQYLDNYTIVKHLEVLVIDRAKFIKIHLNIYF